MGAGDLLRGSDRYAIDAVIRRAEQSSRLEFSLFVGIAEGDPRQFARGLHARLVAPARSVLIMVDPTVRALEVVTGSYARRTLSDRKVELAILEMESCFASGDLVGGLRRGIDMLAEQARAPQTLHESLHAES